ncbi:PIK-related kinase, FAT [Gossypium australe]|uniref:PIK-related kinase, FAT n=1 Tax=Gossypium australe TaxID=47621 RepID=A0A5B6WAA2_9ROSI|nr:PIK-related kinase, FAT [Gossypium australe]
MANSAKKMNMEESNYRTIAIVATTPFIVIGGICIGWKYVSRAWNNKKTDHRRQQKIPRSISMAAIHGGKLALDRLVNYGKQQPTTQSDDDVEQLKTLLENEQPNYKELQQVIGRLEMNRREDEAIKILKKAMKKKKAQMKPNSNEANEIGLLLAEMYIYKGDVKKASKCLAKVEASDAKLSLYKAIISMMDQKEQEAIQHWETFKEIQNQTIPPSFNEEEFTEFKNVVYLLKQDIDAAATQLKKQ